MAKKKQPYARQYALASHSQSMDKVSGLESAIAGKADLSHAHAISSITGLQDALDAKAAAADMTAALAAKAAASHSHAESDIAGLVADLLAINASLSGKAAAETTGNYTGTLTGVTGSVTGTVHYVKSGSIVVLTIPQLTGTSNSTAATLTGMPASIRPARTQVILGRVQDGGVFGLGGLSVGTDGVVTLSNGILFGLFSAILGKGIAGQTVCYSLV